MNIRIRKDAAQALTELGQDWQAVARHLYDEFQRLQAHDSQRQVAEVSIGGRHFAGQVSQTQDGEIDFFVFMPTEDELRERSRVYLQQVEGSLPTHDIPASCHPKLVELLALHGIDASEVCYQLLDSWWTEFQRDPRCAGTSCEVAGIKLSGKAVRVGEGWQFAVDVVG